MVKSTTHVEIPEDGIRDGFKQLGMAKMLLLGCQHVFAMFGATVLVPLLTGFSVSVTLFSCGLGTVLYFFITKKKMPVFLGSSFAFISAALSIANGEGALLPYVALGTFFAGLIYLVVAFFVKQLGTARIMRIFPPVVTAPCVMLLALVLADTGVADCSTNWVLAGIAIITMFVVNLFGKGMIKLLPVLLAVAVSYAVGAIVTLIDPDFLGLTWIDFSAFGQVEIFRVPPFMSSSPLSFLTGGAEFDFNVAANAVITCMLVSLAGVVNTVGVTAAVGAACKRNFIVDPGLHRSLIGDGVGTSVAGLLGGFANTTYSENTGVVSMTKVYDARTTLIAGIFSILLSFFGVFDAFINTIPASILGGISTILYGTIVVSGVSTLMEEKVNLSNPRNMLLMAIILIFGLGFEAHPLIIGSFEFGGLAVSAFVGIVLNLILPGNDYIYQGQGEKD